MFLGHYAVGLAAKKIAPGASLGALIAAPILLDLLWPILLLSGWEHVTIEATSNPFLRLVFDSYPISHGLIAVIGWSTLFASLYFGFTRYALGAIAIWLGVVSHWVMDLIVHRPDLPLYSGSRLFGFGLWNYRGVTIGIELGLLALGIFIYLLRTTAKDWIGRYVFWALVLFLLAAYGVATFGPAPRSVKMLIIATLCTALFIPWAWWLDGHREAKAVNAEPETKQVTPAGG